MKAPLFALSGDKKGEVELEPEVFGADVNTTLLWEYVHAFLSNQRQGTAQAKGRSLVNGSNAKPWKQKGTGRARAGRNTSPLWVRGGKAFGPNPHTYKLKMTKKKKRLSMISALSHISKENKISVLESFALESSRSKSLSEVLQKIGVSQAKCLLVTDQYVENLTKAAGNLKWVAVQRVRSLNPYELLNADHILFEESVLDILKQTKTLGSVKSKVA